MKVSYAESDEEMAGLQIQEASAREVYAKAASSFQNSIAAGDGYFSASDIIAATNRSMKKAIAQAFALAGGRDLIIKDMTSLAADAPLSNERAVRSIIFYAVR